MFRLPLPIAVQILKSVTSILIARHTTKDFVIERACTLLCQLFDNQKVAAKRNVVSEDKLPGQSDVITLVKWIIMTVKSKNECHLAALNLLTVLVSTRSDIHEPLLLTAQILP